MYKVKYGGKKGKTIKLVESTDKVVIRTKGNKDLDTVELSPGSREMIDATEEVAAFPEAGVTVRKVDGAEDLESTGGTRRRDIARAALKEEENIRFAGRVLEDQETGEVMLYTENFFVKFHDKTPEADCLALLEKYRLKIKSKLPFGVNAYFVEAAEGTGLEVFHIAEQILAEKIVEYCHPELVQERKFKAIHPQQWHLARTLIDNTPVDAHVNIEAAWKTTKGKGVTIAVIDDGVDIDHPEFAGRVVHPFDATSNVEDPRPKLKDDDHGTACAGMACAAGLTNGASGTAPESNLMPIRLRSGLGSMSEASAFAWAADHGADVISCSWGPTDGDWWDPNHALHKRTVPLPDSTRMAIDYALNKGRNGKGCVILFAAGNGNEDIRNDGYASYPGVIAVAASNDTGQRSVYSDYGKAIWVTFPSGDFQWQPFGHPAPISQGLRTTDRLGALGYNAGDKYTNTFGGTSGACPGMAGVVALMLAANPALSAAEVKELIRQSCVRIGSANGNYDTNGHSIYYGYGRIDAGRAVENAGKAKAPEGATGSLSGEVHFTAGKKKPLRSDSMSGNFQPPLRVLGLQLRQSAPESGLKVRYKVNVPGVGILEADREDAYAGTADGRRRVIGFSVSLSGQSAGDYYVEYSAIFKGLKKTVVARNGDWCGSGGKTGRTLEDLQIRLVKKSPNAARPGAVRMEG